jgi:hypothetical protein
LGTAVTVLPTSWLLEQQALWHRNSRANPQHGDDAMAYKTDEFRGLHQFRLTRLQLPAAQRPLDEHQITPKIKMLVGDWYVDEFGNRTREIKARD